MYISRAWSFVGGLHCVDWQINDYFLVHLPDTGADQRVDLNGTDQRQNCWVNIWTYWNRSWKRRGKVLTPEIDHEIDRGKVLTPRKDCKIDRDKVLGTNLRLFDKSRKAGQKDERKKQEKIKKNTLKMEPLGNYLTFGNRLWNRPRKVLYSLKETKKEPVKVLFPKKGTGEGTGEGSWLWLTLKRPIEIFLWEPLRSTRERGW